MPACPKRIMVGFDGSEPAARALDTAADLVGYGSTLAVVTVLTGVADRATARAAREQLLRRHVEANYHEVSGEPADELVQKAEELGADLIVVGRGGRSPLRRLLGSVSARVLRRAPCDVLVVS
jgi:nucleotide-binding universal stress UspA family protein